MSSMNNNTSNHVGRKLRILMLHGYTQSGPLFHAKTKALEKSLQKAFPAAPQQGSLQAFPAGIELFYPTAPLRLDATDIPGFDGVDVSSGRPEAYGWWRRKGDGEPYTYEGMEIGLATIAETLQQHGPFDGVLGFSQGGAAAGMVAALLEPGRREAFEKHQRNGGGMRYPDSFTQDSGYIEETIHQPLRFAVSYSGFGASTHPLYHAFYEPKIRTPMCHFIGSADTVVDESRSLRLVDACEDGRGRPDGAARVIYHPGGHFLPSSQKQYVGALVAFIREVLGEDDATATNRANNVEEKVEDMDVPF